MSNIHSVGLRPSLTVNTAVNSFKALLENAQFRDGIKIFLIGAAISASKGLAESLWYSVKHLVIAEMTIRKSDETYLWVMHYFTKHVDWKTAREVEVRARPNLIANESEEMDSFSKDGPYYFPVPSQTFSLYFKGVKIWALRERQLVGESWEESIHLSFLTLSSKPTRDFIQTVKEEYQSFERGKVISYKVDRYTRWSRSAAMAKRIPSSVHLPGKTKEKILEDVRSFLSTETRRWYEDRGIPYRRGYLLHGAPGTGKSSLVHVIASELTLPIYSLSLSTKDLDDATLSELLDDVPSQGIVLLEDVDVAFSSRSKTKTSGVSFSALLNVLDGIGAPEGRICIMTTNHRAKLDSALVRPGRIDLEVNFSNSTKDQAKALFERWYPDSATSEKDSSDALASRFSELFRENMVSMATLQGYLLSHRTNPEKAVADLSGWLKEMEEEEEKKERSAKEERSHSSDDDLQESNSRSHN